MEMNHIRSATIIKGIVVSSNQLLNRFAVFLCIFTYALTGSTVNATYAYTVTSFHAILRVTVTKTFPKAITQLAETFVSANRIKKFLLYEEIHDKDQSSFVSEKGINGSFQKPIPAGIHLKNAYVKWLPSLPDWNLQNITLKVGLGELIAVVGPVGGGKTTLLHTILKELPPTEGSVDVQGIISYASQEPWVFYGSVRQNILFGQEYNDARYKEVIRACALERDFSLFPHGDRTQVGERGITLSGGQKARISLARAVYKEAHIYLLDDPLSAVDAQVGRQLFENCIYGYLKNKCVVLVTHQLQFLKQFQHIYLLENGIMKASGTYEELQNSDDRFSTMLAESEDEEKKAKEEIRKKAGLIQEADLSEANVKVPKQEKEYRTTGTVTWRVYKKYFSAGGTCMTIGLFIGLVLTQVLGSAADYFISFW